MYGMMGACFLFYVRVLALMQLIGILHVVAAMRPTLFYV